MRTLLIDNYDSFTYNLYQYLAAANAQAPTVIRNDELRWEEIAHQGFDNIVISPGPGRPQRASDLGVSADVLRHADVPILGVCLGHQAMGHHCGAEVGLAVRPMHGRLDQVTHHAQGILRGIPSPFEAVRYHSLAVTNLPAELQPLAWTADGTLMALQHVSRPWWGVQFHPESICTEYGARLLRNFRELTQEWQLARTTAAAAPAGGAVTPGQGSQAAQDDGNARLRVHAHCLDRLPDPEAVFTRFFAGDEPAFWLDSSLAEPGRARFSYMGDARGPHAELLSYRSAMRQLAIQRGATREVLTQSIFDYLAAGLARPVLAPAGMPFDFVGGYVGYFGYELKGELEGEAGTAADTPDAMWLRVDRFLAFDHLEQQTWIVCLDQGPLQEANLQWMRAMEMALVDPGLHATEAPVNAAAGLGAMRWRIDLSSYRDLIERCQQEILQGETYEVCLTNQLVGRGTLDGPAVYRALRRRNPAPHAAYLQFGEIAALCASPELFLHVTPERSVESKPIKGTARRGDSPQEDAQIAQALAADEKTRAENLMIVDLLRNDLNRVCEIGSVHVPELFHVESYATVHQLVSTIRGRLREGLSVIDCVRATFPGGSMTGAPKVRTMRILDGLEAGARGIYSGSIGYLSLNGGAMLNIVIRTVVAAGDRVTIGSGGAIVAMSDPDAEVAEIVLKAQAPLEVLRQCGAAATDVPPEDASPSAAE